jgi:hypothetical protein
VSKVDREERIELTALDAGFYRLVLRHGFMQGPNIPSDLAECAEHVLDVDLDKVHCFIGHVDLLAGRKQRGMAGHPLLAHGEQHRGRDRLLPDPGRADHDGRPAGRHPSPAAARRQGRLMAAAP